MDLQPLAPSRLTIALLAILVVGTQSAVDGEDGGQRNVLNRGPITKFFGPVAESYSQYSPYMFTRPGWDSDLMYYCKNVFVPQQGMMRDRVYRIEHLHSKPLSEWINDEIVAEGNNTHADDDLSCSPGVVIDQHGKWHLYYIGASRYADLTLYLLHAVADAPGTSWTKLGPVGEIPQPLSFYFETPTPFLDDTDGSITIFLDGSGLRKLVSTDNGYNFTLQSSVIFTPSRDVQAGRVSMATSRRQVPQVGKSEDRETTESSNEELHILCFSGGWKQRLPTSITFVRSIDGGKSFNTSVTQLLNSTESSAPSWFKGGCVWSPQCRINSFNSTSVSLQVVFAGAPHQENKDHWWGGETSIGAFDVEVSL